MKKLRLVAAVAIAGVFILLSTGAAQAYPDTNGISLTVTSPLVGGKVTHFTAEADATCETITVSFSDGKASGETTTRTGHNTDTLTGSYVTKKVSEKTTTHMTAVCTYDDNVPTVAPTSRSNAVVPAFYVSGSSSAVQAATQHATATAKVILLPPTNDNDNNGILPNTGGLRLSLLVIGGLLVIAGAGVTVAARRRSSSTH